jgi:hypothetical protein
VHSSFAERPRGNRVDVLGNIMGTTTDFTALIPSQHTRWMIVLVCVAAWLIMLRLWGMRDKRAAAATDRAASGT